MEKPSRKEGITVKELGDELMLYDPSSDCIHVLNKTAQVIWEMTEGEGHTLEDMEEEIRKRFFIDKNKNVADDIMRTVAELKEKGVLVSNS